MLVSSKVMMIELIFVAEGHSSRPFTGASHFLWFDLVLRFRVSPRFCVGGLQSGLGQFSMGSAWFDPGAVSEDSRTAGGPLM